MRYVLSNLEGEIATVALDPLLDFVVRPNGKVVGRAKDDALEWCGGSHGCSSRREGDVGSTEVPVMARYVKEDH